MRIKIEIVGLAEALGELKALNRKVDRIMATQAEITKTLKDVLAQQQKTAGEIAGLQTATNDLKQKITDLEKVIADGTVTPELEEAVAAVKAQAQVVDDAIPDVPVEPTDPA